MPLKMSGCLLARVAQFSIPPCSHVLTRTTHKSPHAALLLCTRGQHCCCWRPVSEQVLSRLCAVFRPFRLRLSDGARGYCGVALAVSWFSILSIQSECDQVNFDSLVKNKIVDEAEKQTGWERLTAMYTLDEMGGLTPELEAVANIGTAGMLFGGGIGAMLHSRVAINNFLEKNQATQFETPLVAKRALQDRIMISMFRGFFIFGWRVALFTTAFTLVSTTLMVYTNNISALHYSAAGAVAGALYKVNMGLRGMTAGAIGGGILGVVGGSAISLACYVSGATLPEIRAQQYIWKYKEGLRHQARRERKREEKRKEAEQNMEESAENAQDPTMLPGMVAPPESATPSAKDSVPVTAANAAAASAGAAAATTASAGAAAATAASAEDAAATAASAEDAAATTASAEDAASKADVQESAADSSSGGRTEAAA